MTRAAEDINTRMLQADHANQDQFRGTQVYTQRLERDTLYGNTVQERLSKYLSRARQPAANSK